MYLIELPIHTTRRMCIIELPIENSHTMNMNCIWILHIHIHAIESFSHDECELYLRFYTHIFILVLHTKNYNISNLKFIECILE